MLAVVCGWYQGAAPQRGEAMTVWTLGSINLDHVYRVPRLPQPGETLAALQYSMGRGGNGRNQSVAAARAEAQTCHIGAIGPEGRWVLDLLVEYGVDVAHVTMGQDPSGHAIIYVDPQAENVIVTFAGANDSATRVSVEAARLARARGLRAIYSAAPFQIEAVRAILPEVSMLVMNAGEAAELRAAFDGMPQIDTIVTRGAEGAEWLSPGAEPSFIPSFRVTPVDTTGAGDCFIGTLAAALDAGADRPLAMRRAAASAALQVTRAGAAQAMPLASEVDAFLA